MTNEEAIAKYIPAKKYLGDGCYVESTGYGATVTLTEGLEDGLDSNLIVLEPRQVKLLQQYVASLSSGVTKVLALREARGLEK